MTDGKQASLAQQRIYIGVQAACFLEWDVTFAGYPFMSPSFTARLPSWCVRFLTLLPLVTLCLLSGCGGGSGPSPLPGSTVTAPTGTDTPSIGMTIGSSTVTVDQPVTVTAILKDKTGKGMAGQVLKFSVDAALGTLTPSNGSVLTDVSGIAKIQLAAAGINASGAGYVTAAIKIGDTDVSQTIGFQIGSASLALGDLVLGSSTISAYATTSVGTQVLVNGVPSSTPIPVSFSSACSLSGKASIDASVNSVNGTATATYTDKGCAGKDTITASIDAGQSSKQVQLNVSAPAATSLQYASITPADGVITLKGYGTAVRPENAQVKFKLVDAQGNGLQGRTLQFSLSTTTGGIRFDNQQATTSAQTNSAGEATVTVLAGTLPTPVRVVATEASANLSTQSNGLSISSGFPDQDSMSLALEAINIAGWNIDNVENKVTISMADHFNNPVPDGTAVTIIASGGRVGSGTSGECRTVNSTCTVSFFTQAPQPKSGRVQLTAYAIGEESFTDLNGNNVVDSFNEMRDINHPTPGGTDVGEAFVDIDENGTFTNGVDIPIDFNGNGVYDGPDGLYNGTLCASTFNGCSSRKFMHVFALHTIILSTANESADVTYYSGNNALTGSIDVACGSSVSVDAYIRDSRGNPLPWGSEITFGVDGSSSGAFTLGAPTTQKVANSGMKANTRVTGLSQFPVYISGPLPSSTTDCVSGNTASLAMTIKARSANGEFNEYPGPRLTLRIP